MEEPDKLFKPGDIVCLHSDNTFKMTVFTYMSPDSKTLSNDNGYIVQCGYFNAKKTLVKDDIPEKSLCLFKRKITAPTEYEDY